MNAVKQAKHLIASAPQDESSQTLADLVIALESDQPFDLRRLYGLDAKRFALAIGILTEWRESDRQASKGKLLDLSLQLRSLAIGEL